MRTERSMLPVERPGVLSRVMGTPFSLLDELRSELDRVWDWPRLTRGDGEKLTWWPRMDVFRKKDNLVIKADLPGMKKEDVEVAIEEGDLILRGERKEETELEEENVYRWERSYGSFFRRLPLTFEVKPEAVNANFKDGVLEVTLPIPKEEKKPKAQKIAVH